MESGWYDKNVIDLHNNQLHLVAISKGSVKTYKIKLAHSLYYSALRNYSSTIMRIKTYNTKIVFPKNVFGFCCAQNQLRSLWYPTFSNDKNHYLNYELEWIDCSYNQITSLRGHCFDDNIIPNNSIFFWCNHNQLTSLCYNYMKISKLLKLKQVGFSENPIEIKTITMLSIPETWNIGKDVYDIFRFIKFSKLGNYIKIPYHELLKPWHINFLFKFFEC